MSSRYPASGSIEVSIIIPVFNLENYLSQSLDSVLAQSFKHWEIIAVDDGSTDGSIAVLKEYQSRHERIRIIQRKHQGVSATRNAGIKAAKGKYVVFLDGDDSIAPDMLQTLWEAAEVYALDAVHSNIMFHIFLSGKHKINPILDTVPRSVVSGKEFLRDAIPSASGFACGSLYRRALLKEHHLFFPLGIDVTEDFDFAFRTALKARRVQYIDRPFYYYHKRSASATSKQVSPKSLKDMRKVIQGIKKIGKESQENKELSRLAAEKLYFGYTSSVFRATPQCRTQGEVSYEEIEEMRMSIISFIKKQRALPGSGLLRWFRWIMVGVLSCPFFSVATCFKIFNLGRKWFGWLWPGPASKLRKKFHPGRSKKYQSSPSNEQFCR